MINHSENCVIERSNKKARGVSTLTLTFFIEGYSLTHGSFFKKDKEGMPHKLVVWCLIVDFYALPNLKSPQVLFSIMWAFSTF